MIVILKLKSIFFCTYDKVVYVEIFKMSKFNKVQLYLATIR
jgi:hypothetical protein